MDTYVLQEQSISFHRYLSPRCDIVNFNITCQITGHSKISNLYNNNFLLYQSQKYIATLYIYIYIYIYIRVCVYIYIYKATYIPCMLVYQRLNCFLLLNSGEQTVNFATEIGHYPCSNFFTEF